MDDHIGQAERPNGTNEGAFIDIVLQLAQSVRALIAEALELLVQEGRLAVLSVIAMLAFGVIGAVMLISAWLCLLGALAVTLVAAGVSWVLVFLVLALSNLVLGSMVLLVVRMLSRNLLFRASRRQLVAPQPTG